MRKLLALTLAATLVFGMIATAEAGKKKKPKKTTRKAESTYDTPALGHPDVIVGCSGSTGCATFAVGPTERFIEIEITDQTGLPVYGAASQDLDGDGFGDGGFNLCGKTEEPMPIEPGFELNIFISAAGGTSPPCPGAATTGVAKAVISNLP